MMLSIKAGSPVTELESWGTVADLGSTITEGEVLAFGKLSFGTPTSSVSAGFFACTKGKFDMEYPFTEQAVVIEGECVLLDRRTGQSEHYKAGDAWFVEKGAPITWHILTERFVKHYLAVA